SIFEHRLAIGRTNLFSALKPFGCRHGCAPLPGNPLPPRPRLAIRDSAGKSGERRSETFEGLTRGIEGRRADKQNGPGHVNSSPADAPVFAVQLVARVAETSTGSLR